jgi:gamma-glutamylcyclotransferase (GGCT)/AIG2-like uncharacterized protein YtfP
MGRFLAARAAFIGMGRAPGRLYDLGSYPGMIESAGETEHVRGEVYVLADPETTLPALDRYESCGDDAPRPHQYERCRTMVEMDSGATCACWVYLYRGAFREEMRIQSGDYLAKL